MDAVAEAPETTREVVSRALEEDRATRDLSSLAVVPEGARARGRLECKEKGVLAGVDFASEAFLLCDPEVELDWRARDGDSLEPGSLVATFTGSARSLLAAERTALNFLGHLSGVATQASRARAEAGSVTVLHTRKTLPGLRDAQRQAVVAGGGSLHRRDLAEEILLKENHFSVAGCSYSQAVSKAVSLHPELRVGVEAESVAQALEALTAGASYVLLDNFQPEKLGPGVLAIREQFPQAVLEVSGGRAPGGLADLPETRVDRVSLGSLTHSVRSLDLSLMLEPLS
jgi:nicotinate-nucleotide pyrophosphorylase (carboxylating)